MHEQSNLRQVPLQIHKPCPKKWDELEGGDRKRFCSACSLHVHDAVKLSEAEARELVTGATERVCMRIQYDASGAAIFRDSKPANMPAVESRRFGRWFISAAAGLLAACHGSFSETPANTAPVPAGGAPGPTKMGEMVSTKMGDVAVPLPPPREIMGGIVEPNRPVEAPESPTPPKNDGQ
ncbi:MAG TPA: hypothetical protein VK843_10045 [Planctomycetota bacterium]|nr:hypothetical protein [Planctomycetota bacterium]